MNKRPDPDLELVRMPSKSQQLGSLQRVLYAISFSLSFFDIISDILLVAEWYGDNKTALAMLLMLGIVLSNIVTAMTLYMYMVDIIEVIFSIFGLGSAYHLVVYIICFDNTKERFWSSSSVKIYHLLSLIEVNIESSISTLVQIVHITIFDSLSPIAVLSLITSLLSIGYNYPYHLYRIIGAEHKYLSPKLILLKLICSLDVVSRCMPYAVIYGIFWDSVNVWKFLIAISIFIAFNCSLGTVSVYYTLQALPPKIGKSITISPLFLGLALITSGGFNHSIISLSWNNEYDEYIFLKWPSIEIIIRFIISMAACIVYARIGDSFSSSGDKGTAKDAWDNIMFLVCNIGCWLGLLHILISNIHLRCKQWKQNKIRLQDEADMAIL